jgi:endonuclease-3 related protein
MTAGLTADQLRRLMASLLDAHGAQNWWPGQSRFEIAVGAILVQNTSWTNAARAIARLTRRGLLQPAALLACSEDELRDTIRPAGIYRQKAYRLRCLALWLQRQGGFSAIAAWSSERLRDALLEVHGVGPETADCILLYALQRPVFIVDAYTLRILQRLGLYDANRATPDDLRASAAAAIGADVDFFNEFHALMVEHGKRVCRPRPLCSQCCLGATCRFATTASPTD